MANDNTNPFVLPGFGQSGDAAQNPLIASMEMMRNAWQGMAKAGGFEQVLGANTSVQDLEKRIADLRAVEQWLRMNLSMLSSTIQALEVQQATVSTLNSFLSTVSSNPADADKAASPLEVALGIKPGVTEPEKPIDTPDFLKPKAPADEPIDVESKPASGDSTGLFENTSETLQQATEAVQAAQQAHIEQAVQASQAAEDATKRWWGMLQNQFDTLAEAAAATVQGVNEAAEKLTENVVEKSVEKPTADTTMAAQQPAEKTADKKADTKPASKTASATPAASKATKKAAAKQATAKSTSKTAAKGATKKATKAVTAKKAASKKAAKKATRKSKR